ncbi:DUF397 domain-containing protein [Streptomyces doebereineriae]|uniref:DUF397 domain-containing protein n=1 Tax=Streptomyces doebereineriae TaxID=3075528 RepID=A0ABU2VHX0_9ACTN|nr:DUF397 domain-containing protein [Streptomyces sp. DSM 41640]MDT0484794.1 DUF397 domain-containing protein [Streptomyces sp. DSM 41640]
MPRPNPEVPALVWFKSSYSGGNETECVEAAFIANSTVIRDSKQPHGRRLRVHSIAWTGFVDALRSRQLS